MAGQPCSVVRVGVFDVANRKTVWLDTDVKRDQYLTNVTWHPSDGRLVSQVTKGAFDMPSFLRFSPDKRGLYWETSGRP